METFLLNTLRLLKENKPVKVLAATMFIYLFSNRSGCMYISVIPTIQINISCYDTLNKELVNLLLD